MLRLEFGLGSHLALAASGERHSGVLEVIIGGFARSLSAELNIGIPRRYFPAVEDLQTIRGRIDLDHQARVPPGAALTVRVRHAPLQIDNHLTRALKAVALTLLDQTRSAINRALLLDCLDALQSVKQCALTEALLHRAETNRFERRWQWAVDLGRVFLHGNTPDPVSGGPSAGFSILFALHGLFERALRARLRRGLQGDLALRPTKSIGALLRRSSTGRTYLNLEPDVLIDRKCSLALIGDAKWKRSPQGESLRDDAYQMATYLLRASAGVGFLAYPSTDPISGVCSAERYSVEASDLQLFVLNIDAERLCSSKAAEVALTCDALRNAVAAMIP
jgi:5-methylcytosine-specific restriction endonuclease McrBC regulatory subunit McrC